MRKPDFFIVGAPKCGTSAMWAYLRQHPEIYMSPLKEPHFFGSDLFETVPHPIADRRTYLALFAGAGEEKRVGEASTTYLYSKRAPAEIKEFNPAASVLIMLRNPVDMMYSMHGDLVYWGNEDLRSFEAALEAEPRRKRGECLPPHPGLPIRLLYREIAHYAAPVQRYFEAFGRENVHVTLLDDFQERSLEALRATLRFLSVAEDFEPALRRVNESKRPRSRALERFLARPPGALSWLARSLMSPRQRGRIFHRLRELNTAFGDREPMDPELRRRLAAEFAPEVARLGALLGRDLSQWSTGC